MSRSGSAAWIRREIDEVLRGPGGRATRPRSASSPHPWKGSTIQSLLFDVRRWTPSQARRWAVDHGYRASKTHVTEGNIRIRQHAPRPGHPKRMVQFGRGIQAVLEST